MFHCYPVFPIVKEAKEGWREMVQLMKKPWKKLRGKFRNNCNLEIMRV